MNWHKSIGFSIGVDQPQWMPHQSFRGIPKGEPYTYLGCQVGQELSSQQQVQALLLKLQRKLIYWSSAKLSFTARVLIVNQVLLATIWYVASVSFISTSIISLIQRMILNFLWSGSTKDRVQAKVAWSSIILPKCFGGLGIIDPQAQIQALLAKYFVRTWLPGQEHCKLLARQKLFNCAPSKGGSWTASYRWFLEKDLPYKFFSASNDKFFMCLFRAWSDIRLGLHPLGSPTIEQICRQALVWNSLPSSVDFSILGTRPFLQWGKIAAEYASSFEKWYTFLDLPCHVQLEYLALIRGGRIMFDALNHFIRSPYFQQLLDAQHFEQWIGLFSSLSILLAVCCSSVV